MGLRRTLAKIMPDPSFLDVQLKNAAVNAEKKASQIMRPLLHTACERSLPNLEVKVLVEQAKVDVDMSSYYHSNVTALHILATSSYWWQPHALEYLIHHGASLNVQDSDGYTPLRNAVDNQSRRSAEILLRYGADPNIIGGDSLSCLNKAASQPGISRLLISYGASVTAGELPFMFDAVAAMDVDVIRSMVQAGADCNVSLVLDWGEKDLSSLKNYRPSHRSDTDVIYPIQVAASRDYNTNASRAKMIPVIDCLLQGGADVFTHINKTDSIIHDLCDRDGIIAPFLQIPSLNLEVRDPRGRTLLLAACSHSETWYGNVEDQEFLLRMPSNADLLLSSGANVEALDAKQRNALHCLLSGSSDRKMLQRDFQQLMSNPAAPTLVKQVDDRGMTALTTPVRTSTFGLLMTSLKKEPILLPWKARATTFYT